MFSMRVTPVNEPRISIADQLHEASNEIPEQESFVCIPKVQINPILFCLNIVWMISAVYATIYYIYSPLALR